MVVCLFDKLLKQYGDKIVTNVTAFDTSQYYYFRNEFDQLFGIKKSIHTNEYELIKMLYVEKTFYFNDATNQAMYEHIYEKADFPLRYLDYKFIIINERGTKTLEKTVYDEIYNILKDLLGELVVLDIKGSKAIFYFNNYDIDIEHLFMTISSDFFLDLSVHEGIVMSPTDHLFTYYFDAYQTTMRSQTNNFTDVADVILKVNGLGDHNTMQFFKKLILKNIIEDSVIQQIVNTYFECNLNTSQAAKELYMHRNTLINKLDQIKKTTNLDLQNFKQASTLYLLLNYQE